MKTSILSDLRFLNPSVNCYGIKREQRYKSLFGVKILLYCAVSVLVGFSATMSVAAPGQQIAQTRSPESINRPNLQVGSNGERVTELQAALQLLGFYTGAVDGVYNEGTALAVTRFQQAAGLKADGVVDAKTWQQLFPNEPTVASSGSSPNTSRFPVPSQTSQTSQVVVPTSNSRAATSSNTTATTLKPEPRPATSSNTTATTLKPEPRSATSSNTTAITSKPEPRPATRATTTSNTTATTSTEPRPATRATTTSNTTATTSKPEPRPATRATTVNSRRTIVRQSTTARGSTRSEQTARIQQSDRPRSTTRSEQISSIQYTPEGLPILRPGMRGSEVIRLQRRLQRLGFLPTGNIDGNFGATTEAAVIALQKRYGLNADGVVGGATWEILTRRRGG